jgi:type I restriction enzyme S subunit
VKEKIVPSAWLEQEGRRLDCGPHLSGAMEAKILLANLRAKKEPLQSTTRGGIGGIFHAGREGRRYVLDETHGVRFLGSTDILAADLSFIPLISKAQAAATPKFAIEKKWILITRSGTVGRMAFARPDMHGMACSEHVLRVVPDEKKIPAGYLFAFLSGRFGLPLIVSGTYGSIIQHIEPAHIINLPVPRFGERIEKQVAEKIAEAVDLRSEYQVQVRTATRKLFESLGLQDMTSGTWHSRTPDLGFERKFSSAASLRALNFNPRFMQLCKAIRARSWRPLGELCKPGTLRRGGRYKRIDADPEYSYQLIGQKEIFWLRPEGRWIAKKSVGDDVLVEPGTTLVAAQGTFGESELYCRAEFVWGHALEAAYSEHLLRVVSDEKLMPRGCLFAFMRSETAFRMLRSISMGTKLQDHHPEYLRALPVPYPEKRTRAEIHELVIDAYEKRHRSVRLEDEAVSLVESAIEGDA